MLYAALKEKIKKIVDVERRAIEWLENLDVPFAYFILTFFSAVALRNFLETFAYHSYTYSREPHSFLHFYLFHIVVAITFLIFFHITTRTGIKRAARVVLPSYVIVNLAPILDLVFTKGQGCYLTYLTPKYHSHLLLRFFTFYGDFPGVGVSAGLRIEIALALLASFLYFYVKKIRLARSLLYVFVIYSFLFIYLSTPFILKWILGVSGLANFGVRLSSVTGNYYFLILIFILGIPLAYFADKKIFKLIIGNIRLTRIIHYVLMLVLGMQFGIKAILADNQLTISIIRRFLLYPLFMPIAVIFGFIYSVIINDLEDRQIDRISNPDRPLVASGISMEAYRKLSWFFLFASLFYAIMVSLQALVIMLVFIGNYFIYSAPPLRLKRVPFFSKLAVSFNSLILVMLGFISVRGSIDEFPLILSAIFLIGFTAAANFIDIKDYEGDKAAGIKTLPVILGLKKAKLFIGISFIITYLSFILILREKSLIFILGGLGLLQFYLINRRAYNEKYIFYVYLLGMQGLIIYMIMRL